MGPISDKKTYRKHKKITGPAVVALRWLETSLKSLKTEKSEVNHALIFRWMLLTYTFKENEKPWVAFLYLLFNVKCYP